MADTLADLRAQAEALAQQMDQAEAEQDKAQADLKAKLDSIVAQIIKLSDEQVPPTPDEDDTEPGEDDSEPEPPPEEDDDEEPAPEPEPEPEPDPQPNPADRPTIPPEPAPPKGTVLALGCRPRVTAQGVETIRATRKTLPKILSGITGESSRRVIMDGPIDKHLVIRNRMAGGRDLYLDLDGKKLDDGVRIETVQTIGLTIMGGQIRGTIDLQKGAERTQVVQNQILGAAYTVFEIDEPFAKIDDLFIGRNTFNRPGTKAKGRHNIIQVGKGVGGRNWVKLGCGRVTMAQNQFLNEHGEGSKILFGYSDATNAYDNRILLVANLFWPTFNSGFGWHGKAGGCTLAQNDWRRQPDDTSQWFILKRHGVRTIFAGNTITGPNPPRFLDYDDVIVGNVFLSRTGKLLIYGGNFSSPRGKFVSGSKTGGFPNFPTSHNAILYKNRVPPGGIVLGAPAHATAAKIKPTGIKLYGQAKADVSIGKLGADYEFLPEADAPDWVKKLYEARPALGLLDQTKAGHLAA